MGFDERTPLRAAAGGIARRSPWSSFEERFAEAFVAETEAFLRLVRDGGRERVPAGERA